MDAMDMDNQNTARDADNQNTAKDILINSIVSSVDNRLILKLSPKFFVVPENLKKWNQDAYTPQVVTIGPRFKGTREEFLLMDEVKEKCMVSLISRAVSGIETIIKKCVNVVWELEKLVRASYITKIELKKEELAKIILADACFLLELLISKELDSEFPTLMYPAPAAEVLKDEVVLSDLLLFENQIPMRILYELSQVLFPQVFQIERMYLNSDHRAFVLNDPTLQKINNFALSVLGYSPLMTPCPDPVSHILDLVQFYVNRSTVESTTAPHSRAVIMDSTRTWQKQEVKLKRCALRLLASGVTIKVKLQDDNNSADSDALSCFSWVWNAVINSQVEDEGNNIPELKGLDFWFKFENGILEIKQLHITKTTKAKWCNIIASEHQQSIKMRNRSEDGDVVQGGKFTFDFQQPYLF